MGRSANAGAGRRPAPAVGGWGWRRDLGSPNIHRAGIGGGSAPRAEIQVAPETHRSVLPVALATNGEFPTLTQGGESTRCSYWRSPLSGNSLAG